MTKPEKIYQKYLSSPDSLDAEQLRLALRFADEQPVEALDIRSRLEAERRGAQAENLARDTWVRQGGDVSRFQAAYRELTAERRKAALQEAENEARAASWRTVKRGF